MNNLKVFESSEFGKLEILMIDGKEYFPATACAKKLGHENPSRAVRKFCKGVTELVTPTNGGSQTMRFIPEGDLYRLIVSSQLPTAERFERWIFDEVIPSIRQTGAYISDNLHKNLTDLKQYQGLLDRMYEQERAANVCCELSRKNYQRELAIRRDIRERIQLLRHLISLIVSDIDYEEKERKGIND